VTDLTHLKQSRLYSEELGIELATHEGQQYFASLLFGGHISETIARHTYQAFWRHRLTTPRDILNAGWDFLVNPIMREGGYVGHDFSKSGPDAARLPNARRRIWRQPMAGARSVTRRARS
jgi:hypothetical protein